MVLTQPSREAYFNRLMSVLLPQVQHTSEVQLAVLKNDRSNSYGEYCQQLRERVSGQYSNFVDDDDLVPNDYVQTILPHLSDVDFIGHKLIRYDHGKLTGTYEHSLRHRGSSSPHSTPHINPIKTSLALRHSMAGGFGADRRWWDAVFPYIQSECYIDKVLYEYYYRDKPDGCP